MTAVDANLQGTTCNVQEGDALLCPPEILMLDAMFMERIELRRKLAERTESMNNQLRLAPMLKDFRVTLRDDKYVITNAELSSFYRMTQAVAVPALSALGAPFNPEYPVEYDQAIEATLNHSVNPEDAEVLQHAVDCGRPLAIWRAFKRMRNPGEQRSQANQLMAGRIRAALNPEALSMRKVIKGRVAFPIEVVAEQLSTGEMVLTSKDAIKLTGLGEALKQFADDSTQEGGTPPEYGKQLMLAAETYRRNREVVRGERIFLTGGVELVTSLRKFTLYVPEAVAQQMATYVSTHAPTAAVSASC